MIALSQAIHPEMQLATKADIAKISAGQIHTAFIAGVSALVGALSVAYVNYRTAQKQRDRERDARQRERLQTLSEYVADAAAKTLRESELTTIAEVRAISHVKARKAAMLALIYFPRLKATAKLYHNSLRALRTMRIKAFEQTGGGFANLGERYAKFCEGNPQAKVDHARVEELRLKFEQSLEEEAKEWEHA